MGSVYNMTFASSLTDICEVNSSFDKGVLRICYTGTNRNKSNISKSVLEDGIKSIYNCPIVCNYDRETDTLGGHDMEVVRDNDGSIKLVNSTQPVGVIPESARVWFEDYEDENGITHEYLYADVLLWKRQEAYQKIKRDGITSHSMEISIKSGKKIDGIYYIDKFEFTAFALIGVTPCYESSALEVFSLGDFKQQMSEMMQDLKETFNLVNTSDEDDNIHPQMNSMEGGEKTLDEKMELVAKFGIDVNTLEFSIEDFTVEELTEKFEAMQAAAPEAGEPEEHTEDFALNSAVVEEMYRMLGEEKVTREWGECGRYRFVDCDIEASEIYCYDSQDWLLYGFSYSMNGDNVVIDFESKKRMKCAIVPFDEGEQVSPFAEVFSMMESKIAELSGVQAKFEAASEQITSMETELGELRQFKADIDEAKATEARDAVFAQFEDLVGNEAFEQLKENAGSFSLDDIEEKCYALRGRLGTTAKFALGQKAPKLKVDKTDDMSKEPYGGLFAKYNVVGAE